MALMGEPPDDQSPPLPDQQADDGESTPIRLDPGKIAIGLGIFGLALIAFGTIAAFVYGSGFDIQDNRTLRETVWFASSLGFATIATGVTALFPNSSSSVNLRTTAFTVAGSVGIFALVFLFTYDKYKATSDPAAQVASAVSAISTSVTTIQKIVVDDKEEREKRVSQYIERIQNGLIQKFNEHSDAWSNNWKYVPKLDIRFSCIGDNRTATTTKWFYYFKDQGRISQLTPTMRLPVDPRLTKEGIYWTNNQTVSRENALGYISFEITGDSVPTLIVAFNSARTKEFAAFCDQPVSGSAKTTSEPDPNAAPSLN